MSLGVLYLRLCGVKQPRKRKKNTYWLFKLPSTHKHIPRDTNENRHIHTHKDKPENTSTIKGAQMPTNEHWQRQKEAVKHANRHTQIMC